MFAEIQAYRDVLIAINSDDTQGIIAFYIRDGNGSWDYQWNLQIPRFIARFLARGLNVV